MFKFGNNDKSGVILITVIMFIVVISIILAGLMSRSVSTAMSVEDRIQAMKADILVRGAFWRVHNLLMNGDPLPAGWNETIDGKNYVVSVVNAGNVMVSGKPTTEIRVAVTY